MEEIDQMPASQSNFKNWRKYTFEFLLLFLAVFLGFVADNIREEYSERQQAKELTKNFYDELKSDSVVVASKVAGRIKKEKAIEYMVSFFQDSSLNSGSKALAINFLWATSVRTPVIFTPRTVVLEQLKSSGSLRYFKSGELQKLVGDLSVAIGYLHERQQFEASVYEKFIEPIMVNHMDFDFQYKLFKNGLFDRLAAFENSNEQIPFHLSQIEKIDRKGYMNALSYYQTNKIKSTRLIPFKSYIEVNAALLTALRKEYNL
ncbi:MAG: hypothetical protein ACK514_02800 [Bacteroidota bacterium]